MELAIRRRVLNVAMSQVRLATFNEAPIRVCGAGCGIAKRQAGRDRFLFFSRGGDLPLSRESPGRRITCRCNACPRLAVWRALHTLAKCRRVSSACRLASGAAPEVATAPGSGLPLGECANRTNLDDRALGSPRALGNTPEVATAPGSSSPFGERFTLSQGAGACPWLAVWRAASCPRSRRRQAPACRLASRAGKYLERRVG